MSKLNSLKNIFYTVGLSTLILSNPITALAQATTVNGEVSRLIANDNVISLLRIPVIVTALILIVAVGYLVISVSMGVLRIIRADDEKAKYEAVEAFKTLGIKIVGSLSLIVFLNILFFAFSFLTGGSALKLIFDSFFKW